MCIYWVNLCKGAKEDGSLCQELTTPGWTQCNPKRLTGQCPDPYETTEHRRHGYCPPHEPKTPGPVAMLKAHLPTIDLSDLSSHLPNHPLRPRRPPCQSSSKPSSVSDPDPTAIEWTEDDIRYVCICWESKCTAKKKIGKLCDGFARPCIQHCEAERRLPYVNDASSFVDGERACVQNTALV